MDRLSGVVAQATTALQNGRLVDLITHQATHDQLTGLANRLRFTTELREAVSRAEQASESGALLYVDLDQFKPVNDEFGHEIGDALLVAVAKRLEGCTRAPDVVARLGGDEFAVLLVAAGPGEIETVSQRIAGAFHEPFVVGGPVPAAGREHRSLAVPASTPATPTACCAAPTRRCSPRSAPTTPSGSTAASPRRPPEAPAPPPPVPGRRLRRRRPGPPQGLDRVPARELLDGDPAQLGELLQGRAAAEAAPAAA